MNTTFILVLVASGCFLVSALMGFREAYRVDRSGDRLRALGLTVQNSGFLVYIATFVVTVSDPHLMGRLPLVWFIIIYGLIFALVGAPFFINRILRPRKPKAEPPNVHQKPDKSLKYIL